jgi:hypothetical protein
MDDRMNPLPESNEQEPWRDLGYDSQAEEDAAWADYERVVRSLLPSGLTLTAGEISTLANELYCEDRYHYAMDLDEEGVLLALEWLGLGG